MFISICIPSYNRPREIQRLLESVDCDPSEVEIVVCEDFSPRREEIRQKINLFKSTSRYRVNYLENPENLGYDFLEVP
ncbi:MAG: glycosyltransferase [Proteobacteria bacterium]|nr:glycosyltransferase [Pseudomonadota bacterium]